MPKSKWVDAEEPTINKFYKTGITDNFELDLLNTNRPNTRNTPKHL